MSVLDRFRLDGRKVLITGGSRGLGRCMAQAVAEAGANLILVGREEQSLLQAKTELEPLGISVTPFIGDVGRPEEATRVCEKIVKDVGPVDVLINNVGGRRKNIPTEDLSPEDYREILDLNLTSVVICSQILGREMIARKKGVIINVTSIAGIIVNKGINGRTYETTKAAVESFTRTLAVDWAKYNIRANNIAPGGFLTDPNRRWFGQMPELQTTFESNIPMGRLGNPDEIGPLALYLASDASSYVTGATFVIDGGYTLW